MPTGSYSRTRIPRRYAHWVSTTLVNGRRENDGGGRTSVHIHLDNTIFDRGPDLILRGTRTTVENEEPEAVFERIIDWGRSHAQGLGGCTAQLFADVFLMLTQKFRVKLDVARLVNTVDISESSSDTEARADGAQGCVDIPDVLRLSVKLGVVDTRVIDTILLTTSDADLHLEPDTEGDHTFEVLDASGNIILLTLFGKIKHVRGE